MLGSPTSSASCQTALTFVKTLLREGHEVHRVFFFLDAVHIGNSRTKEIGLSKSLQNDWRAIASDGNVELTICVSAAARRGIQDTGEQSNVADGFNISGLGQLIESMNLCDRFVTFP